MTNSPRVPTLEKMPDPETLGPILDRIHSFLETLDKNQYLAELIKREPHLEIIAPHDSGSLWFRYTHAGVDERDLDGLNRMILYALWETDEKTILDEHKLGKYTMKASKALNESNHTDLDILVEKITTMGDTLVQDYL